MNRLHLFFRCDSRDRLLFIEAFLLLIWARFVISVVPFRRIVRRLGQAQVETSSTVPAVDRAVAVKISWAIQAVARHVPLGFVCLPQAIAAQRMLRRRGLASTFYLGVATDREKKESMTAHAWLRVGDKIVTGGGDIARQRILATFADSLNIAPN